MCGLMTYKTDTLFLLGIAKECHTREKELGNKLLIK